MKFINDLVENDPITVDWRNAAGAGDTRNLIAPRTLTSVLVHEKNLRTPRTSEECYFVDADMGFVQEREPIDWSTWAIVLVGFIFVMLVVFGVIGR